MIRPLTALFLCVAASSAGAEDRLVPIIKSPSGTPIISAIAPPKLGPKPTTELEGFRRGVCLTAAITGNYRGGAITITSFDDGPMTFKCDDVLPH